MKKIANYLLFGFLLLISFLPMIVLYFFSAILYFFLFYIFGYRKKVVFKNLNYAFPEKSKKEISQIARKFYWQLSDTTLETLKGLTISKKNLLKRFYCTNPEVLEPYKDTSIFIMSGHYTNWEFLILALNLMFDHRAIGVGRPLTNQTFNKLLNNKRSRFGMIIINANNIREKYEELKDLKSASLYLSDQYTSKRKKHYEGKLFNRKTLFAYGAEKFARQYNYPVFFLDIKKKSKGKYVSTLKLISDKPNEEAHEAIMEKYVSMLEEMIMREPAYWLWSHKRWKNVPGLYKL